MSLNQAQIDLLNNFYKSQPALNVAGLPSAEAGIALGSVLQSLESAVSTIPTLPTMGAATTNASGNLAVTGMTATGKVVVTPSLTMGADKVFDHVECGVNIVKVFLRTVSTDVVAAAGAGLAFSYIVIALA